MMGLPPRIDRSVTKAVKQPREGDSVRHLRWIKTLPCLLCVMPATDPHHLLRVDNLPKGTGRRNEDRWAIPLCRKHHDEMHEAGKGAADDEAYLASLGYDARRVCAGLWSVSGDTESGRRIVFRAHQAARLGRV